MGDNIHAPTIALAVPSGSEGQPTGSPTNGNGTHKSLFDVMAARDRVMAELSALSSVLESHKADMNTPLVTPDGFPRADIDVAQIRTTRAKIIRLRNDYKGYMDTIEKGLHQHHAQLAASATSNVDTPQTNGHASPNGVSEPTPTAPIRAPFARVNSVVDDSPADAAGLRAGDMITQFGDAVATNHEDLRRLAQVVKDNEGRQIMVKVRRALQDIDLTLIPRSDWGGRGSLGCHLLPLQ